MEVLGVQELKDRMLVPCLVWKENVDHALKMINLCVYAYLHDWQIVVAFVWHSWFFLLHDFVNRIWNTVTCVCLATFLTFQIVYKVDTSIDYILNLV